VHAPSEWTLSSNIATGMENVLIFTQADTAENELEKFLRRALLTVVFRARPLILGVTFSLAFRIFIQISEAKI
jgi:hypothetical protein